MAAGTNAVAAAGADDDDDDDDGIVALPFYHLLIYTYMHTVFQRVFTIRVEHPFIIPFK